VPAARGRRRARKQSARANQTQAPPPDRTQARPGRPAGTNAVRSLVYRRPLQALLLFAATFLSGALALNALHIVHLRPSDLLGLAIGVLLGVSTLYLLERRRRAG
jgi:hypothetical protein